MRNINNLWNEFIVSDYNKSLCKSIRGSRLTNKEADTRMKFFIDSYKFTLDEIIALKGEFDQTDYKIFDVFIEEKKKELLKIWTE